MQSHQNVLNLNMVSKPEEKPEDSGEEWEESEEEEEEDSEEERGKRVSREEIKRLTKLKEDLQEQCRFAEFCVERVNVSARGQRSTLIISTNVFCVGGTSETSPGD